MSAPFLSAAGVSALPIFPIIVFGIIAAFIIIGVIATSIAEKKRTQAWAAVAENLGFSFENINEEIHQQYPFKLFDHGSSRVCRNLLTGTAAGTSIILADYQYTVNNGKNSSTHRTTICIAESNALNLPTFFLRPENFFDRFGERLGGQDYDFDEDPEFSENYVLQGENEDAIRTLFNDPTREFFVEYLEDAPNAEGSGNAILLHFGNRIAPEDSTKLMEFAFELMKLWAQ